MKTDWLYDFLSLGRTLNFTKAAKDRHITQSAFSRRIKMLEIWVGSPLINRSTYPVELTEAGENLLPIARDIVFQLANARQSFPRIEEGGYKFQRFAVLHAISINFLSKRLSILEKDYPELKAHIFSDNLLNCCQMLHNNACDFLLYYQHQKIITSLDENLFAHKDVGDEKLIPVAKTTTAIKNQWQLSDSKKNLIPYLSYEPNTFLGSVVNQTMNYHKTNLKTHYIDALAEGLKHRVLAGSGVAWLPERTIAKELSAGVLMPIGDERWHANLTISLFCSPEKLDAMGHIIWETL